MNTYTNPRVCGFINDAGEPHDKAVQILYLRPRLLQYRDVRELVIQIYETSSFDLIKFASALTLAAHLMEEAPKSIVDYFFQVLKNPYSLSKEYKPIALRDYYDVIDEVAFHLPLIAEGRRAEIVDYLLGALNSYSSFNAVMLAHSALTIASHTDAIADGASFIALTTLQQKAVIAIAESDLIWRLRAKTSDSLKFFHLPYRRSELRKYCRLQ